MTYKIFSGFKEKLEAYKQKDLLNIIDEILVTSLPLSAELQLLQSRGDKEQGQQTVAWETLRLDNSPFKINPLKNVWFD